MRAQGNILADYFLLEFRNSPENVYQPEYAGSNVVHLYRATLDRFLRHPGDKRNLPNVTR